MVAVLGRTGDGLACAIVGISAGHGVIEEGWGEASGSLDDLLGSQTAEDEGQGDEATDEPACSSEGPGCSSRCGSSNGSSSGEGKDSIEEPQVGVEELLCGRREDFGSNEAEEPR